MQQDITADGKPINSRVIVSYPPFGLSRAGRETISGARFAKSYRPDGRLGCGGRTERVRFQIGRQPPLAATALALTGVGLMSAR